MAFLDNSGDIILDAVLTDAGRQRMARGEFKIVKFALSDEEIDYSLYNGAHPSGSAFADLSIMQTPILEAFTNNTSLMKTKLISINRNNILYLPILRVNNKGAASSVHSFASQLVAGFNGFYMSADETTDAHLKSTNGWSDAPGFFPNNLVDVTNNKTKRIGIDQGKDTGGSPSVAETLEPDLVETAFLIRVDHRLLRLHSGATGYEPMTNSFVDDDAIASYYVDSANGAVVTPAEYRSETEVANSTDYEMFDGPLGPQLSLMVKASQEVQASEALFDELGTTATSATKALANISNSDAAKYKFIDTTVNVVGVTSGYSIDIPIRIWKKAS